MIMGTGRNSNTCYLIDFGLSKPWRTKHGKHTPYSEDRSLTGTARYASINNHLGREQSRRDDLESLAYSMLYFIKGSLPWQGLGCKEGEEKYDRIYKKKAGTSVSELCKGLPTEFASFLCYCRHLGFEEEPNYSFWRHVFEGVAKLNNIKYDGVFDWVVKRNAERAAESRPGDGHA